MLSVCRSFVSVLSVSCVRMFVMWFVIMRIISRFMLDCDF